MTMKLTQLSSLPQLCNVAIYCTHYSGGFAHVYLAKSSIPLPVGSPTATTKHVLKRMAVPDKRGVHEVGKEVEVMVSLHSFISTYPALRPEAKRG